MSLFGRILSKNIQQIVRQVFNVRDTNRKFIHTGLRLCIADVQKPAPFFKGTAVIAQDFKEISLADFNGKYLVMFFYPLDFTFVCPTEIVAFSDRIEEFQHLGAEVIGVSVDSHFSHLAWCNINRNKGGVGELKYPLLSDITKSISQDYGVLIKEAGVALRGTFIIDQKGIIRQKTINDLPIGRSVDETLRLLKALQFYETHGEGLYFGQKSQNYEVCPVNWDPVKNAATIKPSPKESQAYFNEQGQIDLKKKK